MAAALGSADGAREPDWLVPLSRSIDPRLIMEAPADPCAMLLLLLFLLPLLISPLPA
jgi:hypothetical protein